MPSDKKQDAYSQIEDESFGIDRLYSEVDYQSDDSFVSNSSEEGELTVIHQKSSIISTVIDCVTGKKSQIDLILNKTERSETGLGGKSQGDHTIPYVLSIAFLQQVLVDPKRFLSQKQSNQGYLMLVRT